MKHKIIDYSIKFKPNSLASYQKRVLETIEELQMYNKFMSLNTLAELTESVYTVDETNKTATFTHVGL